MNIKEIAKKANVSVATISRVLNHPQLVQPETRKHVLEVMEKYNYTPNWFARSLNLTRTNTIALMIPNIENHMYQKITAGVEQVAHKKNYIILLCNTHKEKNNEQNYMDMIITRKVDGVIFVSSRIGKEDIKKLKDAKIPFVYIGKNKIFDNENTCYINFEDSACKMIEYLFETGYEGIDVIIDEVSSTGSDSIIRGYNKAINKLDIKAGNIHRCGNTIEDGYLLGRKLISQNKLPRAIFSYDDEVAFGIMKAAKEENIKIPTDLAITGFTNSPMSTLIEPELTSVEQPSKRLGMVATRMLFDLLEYEEYPLNAIQNIILQSSIKIRRSCGNKSISMNL